MTETLDQKVARLIKMLDKHGQQQRSAGWDERGDGDSPDNYDVAAVAVRKDFEAALRTELATPPPVAGDAETILAKICDAFCIGSKARTESTILANVENALRRSNCLWAVEHAFFMVPTSPDEDEGDGEPGEECLLNWGQDPTKYVEQFRTALATLGVTPSKQEGV